MTTGGREAEKPPVDIQLFKHSLTREYIAIDEQGRLWDLAGDGKWLVIEDPAAEIERVQGVPLPPEDTPPPGAVACWLAPDHWYWVYTMERATELLRDPTGVVVWTPTSSVP